MTLEAQIARKTAETIAAQDEKIERLEREVGSLLARTIQLEEGSQ